MGELEFMAWMETVDEWLDENYGLAADDLPDLDWRDWFEEGMRPLAAGRKAIRYSGGPV